MQSNLKKFILIFLGLIGLSLFWLWLQIEIFSTTHLVHKEQTYSIPKGASLSTVAKDLERLGWIDNHWFLRLYAQSRGDAAKPIIQGEYEITPKMQVKQFMDSIKQGSVKTYSFTILPGSTMVEVLANLRAIDNIEHKIPPTMEVDDLMTLIDAPQYSQSHAEGMFFAETYHYTSGVSDLELLNRAHQLLVTQFAQECPAIPNILQSSYRVLILASIVEKESGSNSEEGLIASVFTNRLVKKMRLEADPTVIYGLGAEYQGDIKTEHLRRRTPYNTYKIAGLPPTPIANLSRQAIHASCQPEDSEYLYFVADGKGGHVFTTKYEDHKRAVRDYIRHQRQLK